MNDKTKNETAFCPRCRQHDIAVDRHGDFEMHNKFQSSWTCTGAGLSVADLRRIAAVELALRAKRDGDLRKIIDALTA